MMVDDPRVWPVAHELCSYIDGDPRWGYLRTVFSGGGTTSKILEGLNKMRPNQPTDVVPMSAVPLDVFMKCWCPVGYDRAGMLPRLAQAKLLGYRLPTIEEYQASREPPRVGVCTLVWVLDEAKLRKHFDDWKAADAVDRLSDANRNA